MNPYTPQQFADKWESAHLKERASAQEHFTDLRRLVDHPTPAEKDPDGTFFTYEYGLQKTGGGQGGTRGGRLRTPGSTRCTARWIVPCATPTARSMRCWRMTRKFCGGCWR